MANTTGPIPLSHAPLALRDQGITITYPALYRRASAGTLPVHRYGVGWFIERADLPAIVAALAPTHGIASRAA